MDPSKLETKEKILFTAAQLFASNGFYHVSVREICEAAGVTKPVLYYYFKDKETLLMQLLEESHRIMDELREKYLRTDLDFVANIKGVCKLYKELVTKYPNLVRFSAFVQFMSVPQAAKEFKYLKAEEGFGVLLKYFSSEQKKGVFREGVNIEMLAGNFLGSIVLIISKYILYQENVEEFEKKMDQFIEFWIDQFVVNHQ